MDVDHERSFMDRGGVIGRRLPFPLPEYDYIEHKAILSELKTINKRLEDIEEKIDGLIKSKL